MAKSVMDYETADPLPGELSAELVAESHEAAPTGAVLAYLDDEGVWQYVMPMLRSLHEEHLRHHVRTVYVEERFADGDSMG